MSKIKKLTTQLKNSSFSPPKRARKREEDEEPMEDDFSRDYLKMDEAIKDIYDIYVESENIFPKGEYDNLDSKTKKEIDNLKENITSVYKIISTGSKRLSSIKGPMVNAKLALSKLKIIKKVNTSEKKSSSNTSLQPELSIIEEKEKCSLKQLDEDEEEYKNKKKEVIEKLGGTNDANSFAEDFKIDIKTECDVDEIVKRIKLKLELIRQGYFDKFKLQNVIDYVSYDDIEELGIETVAGIIEDFEKYKRTSYTPKQIKKSYEQVSDSFIIEDAREGSEKGMKMIKYIKTFKDNPEYMLRTLLWLDTFHDFKDSRIGSKLNNIIQEFYPDEADYAFDVFYRNSFFKFDNKDNEIDNLNKEINNLNIKYQTEDDKTKKTTKKQINTKKRSIKKLQVSGFSDDIIHTVLSGIEKIGDKEMAQLLFDVSEIVINKSEFESDLFYAYMIINFDIKIDSRETFMVELKNILWNQISAVDVPYYAKDVDRGSGNLLQGNLVILPASVFDANPSNSSDDGKNFVKIKKTVIPFANGYEFEYNFKVEDEKTKEKRISETDKKTTKRYQEFIKKDDCLFTLNYKSENEVYTLNQLQNTGYTLNPLQNKCLSSYESSNEIKNAYKDLDKAVNNKHLDSIKELIDSLYFKENTVNLPLNTKGMSPGDIVTVIIGLLQGLKKGEVLSCSTLDFWVSLKRIGDYGQILQCKQLDIPLFTTDSMQLLISLAVKSSVIWSPDFTKVLWYDAVNDAIMCNGYNPLQGKLVCSKKNINNNKKKVIYKGGFYTIVGEYIETDENGQRTKYRIQNEKETVDVSFNEIQPYDINYMLDKKGFKREINPEILLENTVDKDEQILKDLKPIPNIRDEEEMEIVE